MTRFIFINRVYWPSPEATAQLLRDLTHAIAATGTQVSVITDSPAVRGNPDDTPNLTVYRTGGSPHRKLGVAAKLAAYSKFIRAAKTVLKDLVTPGDVVVAMTDPPMLGAKIGPTVRQNGGLVWHWSQDVYPEVALAIKPFGPFTHLLRMLIPGRNREWARSSGIVAIGADMADRIASCGIPRAKISVSPNWAPIDSVPQTTTEPRQAWGIRPESFRLSYSGNLGRAHTLVPLVNLVRLLQPYPQVETLIVGEGPQKAQLKKSVAVQNLQRCTFHPPVPIAQLASSLAASHVQIITMRPDCVGTVWPSKFYGIIAVARPIIFIGPKSAEIAQLIQQNQLGIAVGPSDLTAAQKFVVDLLESPDRYAKICDQVNKFAQRQPGLPGAVQFWKNIVSAR